MIAYKFLRAGRIGPFSGFEWPASAWVRASGEPHLCKRGIHACRTQDLPWWLADELWKVELDGPVHLAEHKIIAPAGRLISRIDGWTSSCAQEYGDACAWRARDSAVTALTRGSHRAEADTLAACATLDDLVLRSRDLARSVADTRISLTIAGDGAVRALSGATPTSAYIAAHAALRLDGPAGYAAERARQARWLIERLGLQPDG